MRGDDIVVELAQILIDIIFKKIDLLVVQVDRDVRLAADRVVERVVKHLLGNVLGRPDFISYKLADLPMFEVWFLKHILHLPVAVWTLRTPDALKKGKRHYDMQIFEKKNTYY